MSIPATGDRETNFQRNETLHVHDAEKNDKENVNKTDLELIVKNTIDSMPEPSPFIKPNFLHESKVSVNADADAVSVDNVSDNVSDKISTSVDVFGAVESGSKVGFLRDEKGGLFDPEIHVVDDDGEPKLNKDGSFRKKRGRKKGSDESSVSASNYANRQAAKQAGEAMAQTIFTVCAAIFGEEWQPIVDQKHGVNEPVMMADAWATYFEATGVKEIPPWLGVAIVCSAYSLPRTRLPQTKSKLKRFSEWVGKKFNFKRRK